MCVIIVRLVNSTMMEHRPPAKHVSQENTRSGKVRRSVLIALHAKVAWYATVVWPVRAALVLTACRAGTRLGVAHGRLNVACVQQEDMVPTHTRSLVSNTVAIARPANINCSRAQRAAVHASPVRQGKSDKAAGARAAAIVNIAHKALGRIAAICGTQDARCVVLASMVTASRRRLVRTTALTVPLVSSVQVGVPQRVFSAQPGSIHRTWDNSSALPAPLESLLPAWVKLVALPALLDAPRIGMAKQVASAVRQAVTQTLHPSLDANRARPANSSTTTAQRVV